MALGIGYGLPFAVKRPVGQYMEDMADAAERAAADAGQREAANNCLDARGLTIMQRVQTQPSVLVVPQLYKAGVLYDQLPNTRTNYLPNNTMVGATGSVLPSGWSIGALPAGITVGYSASGSVVAADGVTVNYIDVTVSGTAGASGFLNLRPLASPSTVSAVSGQTWTTSVYLSLVSGSVSFSPTWQLQETTSGGTFLQGSNIQASGITSSLERYNVSRTLTDSTTALTTVRWGHSIVSGTTYNYTIRIASPQLEELGRMTAVINTASGAVTVLNNSTNVVGFPPDFTVSRNTTATRVNSSGLIESVASGVPRLDWLGQSCPALLVEASGTNFARWVNQMNAQDTPTASGGLTTTTGSTDFLAPNGTSGSITKYVGGAASGTSQSAYYSGGGITVTASGQHTFSLFVKRGATNPLTFCALGIENFAGGSGTIFSYFNLASGTALTAGASVQDYGNGWYRLISAPYTIASTDLTGTLTFFMAEGNGDLSWPASGALNLTAYTWGAQLEPGSVATTYIPTTTTTASRAADVISASGALVSGLIGQTEGTIYAEVDLTSFKTSPFLTISDGTDTNRIQLSFLSNTVLLATIRVGGVNHNYSATIPAIPSSGGIYKVTLGYAANNYCFALNGVIYSSTATRPVPACSVIGVGTSATNNAFLNDRIRAAALYTTRLSNDQLANLTALT